MDKQGINEAAIEWKCHDNQYCRCKEDCESWVESSIRKAEA